MRANNANQLLAGFLRRILITDSSEEDHVFSPSPRGRRTLEILGLSATVTDPARRLVTHPARKLNIPFAGVETLWNIAGRDDVGLVARFNSKMRDFSDDGRTLRSCYGHRALSPQGLDVVTEYGQWMQALQALNKDPDTRQAVIVFRRAGEVAAVTKDQICGLHLQMFLRDGALHGTACFRSNDMWLGVPYDFFFVSVILEITAIALNADLGGLTWTCNSGHLYQDNASAAIELLKTGPPLPPRWPVRPTIADAEHQWRDGTPETRLKSAVKTAINLCEDISLTDPCRDYLYDKPTILVTRLSDKVASLLHDQYDPMSRYLGQLAVPAVFRYALDVRAHGLGGRKISELSEHDVYYAICDHLSLLDGGPLGIVEILLPFVNAPALQKFMTGDLM